MKKTVNALLSIIFIIAVMMLIITVSIGLPIYVRPFYYAHVYALDFDYYCDYTKEEIIEAYDEVLDFLTLEGREFGTGKMLHSVEGKKHFEDCKVLFDLNRNALIIAAVVVILLTILNKKQVIKLAKPKGLRLSFWSAAATLGGCALLGAVCAVDFSSAFRVFHLLFFPGKDNWMFDPYEDEIIMVMPEEFFMNCAILICASLALISVTLIVRAIKKREK